jgi:glutathione S-transferase
LAVFCNNETRRSIIGSNNQGDFMSQKPHLVSFKLCPFVQRSVITLLHKGVDFDITYIDLANKPDWFLEISPLGKVPVLRVGETSVFESAVINEYLDETEGKPLHPKEPLARALNRAWIEFGSNIIMDQYVWSTTQDQDTYTARGQALREKLERLELQLGDGPYFNGEAFSLVDTALAPIFMRQLMIEETFGTEFYMGLPKLKFYTDVLMDLAAVQKSVVEDFKPLFIDYLKDSQSVLVA